MPVNPDATPEELLAELREAFANTLLRIQAHSPHEAWPYMGQLDTLVDQFQSAMPASKGWLFYSWQELYGYTQQQLADLAGMSRPRVAELIKHAREKGHPVSKVTETPLSPPLIICIITADNPARVLVAERRNKVPPFTFIDGDMRPGETPHDAAVRVVHETIQLPVTGTRDAGMRLHPLTTRLCVYVYATTDRTDYELTGEGAREWRVVTWASIPWTRENMENVYEPVRAHLNALG